LGKAVPCYSRTLHPEFGDSFGTVLRRSSVPLPNRSTGDLPNTRFLSNALMSESEPHPSRIASQILMNCGQVLTNEITYPAVIFPDFSHPCCKRPDNETNSMTVQKWRSVRVIPFTESTTIPVSTSSGLQLVSDVVSSQGLP
jgi:hypothetical protein